jgi:surfeit locus 1 family protein
MRPRAAIIAIVALVLASACVRLGLWQLGRWQEKRRANGALGAALAAPAAPLRGAADAAAGSAPRRVRARGAYDESWHLLVSDQWDGDSAGVELLTPLKLEGGGAVLVDRGWLPSSDGIRARPQERAEPGGREIEGLLEKPPAVRRPLPWERLSGDDGPALWSARALELDSARARLPYPLADRVLLALPGPSAPALPRRRPPEPADSGMHLGYAVQWALFALAFLAGGTLVLVRERAAARAGRV